MVTSRSHRNAGEGSKRADYGPLGHAGGHSGPHVTGKGGPTPPQVMRRDQPASGPNQPNQQGFNRVLNPPKSTRGF
jgi:hypothetical protein